MHKHAWNALGTVLSITIWDDISSGEFELLKSEIIQKTEDFENTYSRFRAGSVVTDITDKTGIIEVPKDFINILKIYQSLFKTSGGKFTPLIGGALEDAGYDKERTLIPKSRISKVPDFFDAVTIIDDTHIEKKFTCQFDFGAAGKGYLVDILSDYLEKKGIKRFLTDGSGDVYYSGDGTHIKVGLEHPADNTKVIGSIDMTSGAMCSSATNKRKWAKYNHYIDPFTGESPTDIIAVWVLASSTVIADAVSSVLFFAGPESIKEYDFEYCILRSDYKIKHSEGFNAEFY